MKILNLSKELQIRALNNQELQGNRKNPNLELDAGHKEGNFDWSTSLEGMDFWDEIYEGNYWITPKDQLSKRGSVSQVYLTKELSKTSLESKTKKELIVMYREAEKKAILHDKIHETINWYFGEDSEDKSEDELCANYNSELAYSSLGKSIAMILGFI